MRTRVHSRHVFHTLVEVFENRQDGFLELGLPVQSAALGGGGAVGVHPIHAVFVHKADEALGQFFNSFVERFAGGVAIVAEDLVLGFHDAGQGAHKGHRVRQ